MAAPLEYALLEAHDPASGRYDALRVGQSLGLSATEMGQLHETGELVHRRALSKVRNGERSSGYVEALLRRAGAPPRWPGEATCAWLERVLPLVSSPYVHGLIGRHRRRVRIAAVAHAYPKQRLLVDGPC
jgi:hypothetical protein